MKRLSYIRMTALVLLMVMTLSACQFVGGDTESGTESLDTTVEEGTTETGLEEGTTVEAVSDGLTAEETTTGEQDTEETTEETTAMPRFDYFSADMADYATIDRADYLDMQITLPADLQVSDADVERYLMQLRFDERTRAETAESETMVDEALEWGDDAYIYYTGYYLNGEPFSGGSNEANPDPTTLGLGSSDFIPGFEEGLVGVIPSNTSKENPVQISLRFPSTYGNSDLAGQDVIFEVYVVYAVEYTLPEYNVSFVEDQLKYEFKQDSYDGDEAKLAEFQEVLRDELEAARSETIAEKTQEAFWKHLMEVVDCHALPELEVAFYEAYYLEEFEAYYEQYKYYGYDVGTFDEFVCKMMGLAEGSDWRAEMTKQAEKIVTYDVIRYTVAQMEGIRYVTDDESEEEIQYWIDYYKDYYGATVTKEEVLEYLGEEDLRRSAMTEKMNTFFMEHCTVQYATA